MIVVSEEDVLEYHEGERPGKLQIQATKPLLSQRDFALAYSPGVAYAVTALAADPLLAYRYTAKGNLVAVVTNGTAILGLGNRGPVAAKPVMEGKAVLFKRLADVDVFDIELNAPDAESVIEATRAIAPGFGGINLEDIAAPAAFEVEERLQEALDIPVFHDDQHGTAIIVGAALHNALELTGKDIHRIRVVVIGAGAAGVATANFFVELGVPLENITMFDRIGMVYQGRQEEMDRYKERFARSGPPETLEDALRGADVLLGLSAANVVTPEMVRSMAPDPILFTLANPEPEIDYRLALETRPDAIVATGRSDLPNQVNNVLAFPYIFRGALDVQARAINLPMQLAAARALAGLAKEYVPESVLRAYGVDRLSFGRDYILPKPNDDRLLESVAPAVAQAAIESGVARRVIDIEAYRERLQATRSRGWRVVHSIYEKARQSPKRVVFVEGEHPTILRAVQQMKAEGLSEPVLLGNPETIAARIRELGLRIEPRIIEPGQSERAFAYAQEIYRLRQRKGVTMQRAQEMVRDHNIFGLMMLRMGDADGVVSGLTYEYPAVVRPTLQLIRTRPGVSTMVGAYIVIARGRAYFFADALINVDPDSGQLAEIAILTAGFVRQLDIEPHLAMISFSNFGSVPGSEPEKVQEALRIAREREPALNIDGEMQVDTALSGEITDELYPFSRVRNANTLIFPNLDAANSSLKVLSQLGDVEVIGPILVGANQPVQVLQHAATVQDVVRMAALTAMDAQDLEQREAADV